jgi:hypothetical protein
MVNSDSRSPTSRATTLGRPGTQTLARSNGPARPTSRCRASPRSTRTAPRPARASSSARSNAAHSASRPRTPLVPRATTGRIVAPASGMCGVELCMRPPCASSLRDLAVPRARELPGHDTGKACAEQHGLIHHRPELLLHDLQGRPMRLHGGLALMARVTPAPVHGSDGAPAAHYRFAPRFSGVISVMPPLSTNPVGMHCKEQRARVRARVLLPGESDRGPLGM